MSVGSQGGETGATTLPTSASMIPFAIERDQTCGSEAKQAFDSIVEAAQAGVGAETFHWCATNFERH